MKYPHIDFILRGEAENPCWSFIAALRQGLITPKLPAYHTDSVAKFCTILLILLWMILILIRLSYHRFSGNKLYDLGFVVSSRGCPHRCIFAVIVLLRAKISV